MTEEAIKEALSNNYVSILANRQGFKLIKSEKDAGVDYTIKYELKRISHDGSFSFIDSPYSCDLQMKSTISKNITLKEDHLLYDLRAKNYNDLIYRKNLGNTPLVLILFVLPNEKSDWVKVLDDELIISKNAYWFYPEDKEIKEVKNKYSKRIQIPKANKLNFDFFDEKIKKWIPKWKSTE